MFKAYAFLWEKCTKGMQNKIASRKDFETRIYNHPINLLKSIKEHSLNYQETRYEMSIIMDSICSFMNAKQKENESLHDYTRHFKTCRDILESQLGGPIVLKKYIQTLLEFIKYNERMMEQENKTQSESDSDQESKDDRYKIQQNIELMKRNLIKKASEKLYAFIYLENSNQNKFAGVIETLSQQKSFGYDQFPNMIVEASEILSNHNYENNKIKNAQRNAQRNANKINTEINKNIEKGENKNVNQVPIPTLSFAQLKIGCYCCGK